MDLTAYQKNSHWKTCQKKISRNKYRDFFFLKETTEEKYRRKRPKGCREKV